VVEDNIWEFYVGDGI